MEKNSKKTLTIVLVIVIILALVSGIVCYAVNVSKLVYLKVFKLATKGYQTFYNTTENFNASIDGKLTFYNDDEFKDVKELIDGTKFDVKLQTRENLVKAQLDLKDKDNKDIINGIADLDLYTNENYMKIDQLSDKWIELGNEDTDVLKKVIKTDENGDALLNPETMEMMSKLKTEISGFRFEKGKEKIEYQGKVIDVTRNSIYLEETEMSELYDIFNDSIEEKNEDDDDYEEDEENLDFDAFEDFDEDDLFDIEDIDEDIDEDDEDDYGDEEEIDNSSYGCVRINLYTKGFIKKDIIGFSIEKYECNSEDACSDKEICVDGNKEFELKCIIENDKKIVFDFNTYEDGKIFNNVNFVITEKDIDRYEYSLAYTKEDRKVFDLEGNISVNQTNYIESVNTSNTIKVEDVDIEKLQDIELFKKLNAYLEKKELEQIEINKPVEEPEKTEEEKNNIELFDRQNSVKIFNSAFEIYKGEDVKGDNVKLLIELIKKTNEQSDNKVAIKIDTKKYDSLDEAKNEIKNSASYRVIFNYNTDEEVSVIDVFSK